MYVVECHPPRISVAAADDDDDDVPICTNCRDTYRARDRMQDG
jgi:hypothetical protein